MKITKTIGAVGAFIIGAGFLIVSSWFVTEVICK